MDQPVDDPAALGALVRARRAKLGLDQQTLAALAGVSERFLRELEHGKPTVRLREVAAVLDALGLGLWVRSRGE